MAKRVVIKKIDRAIKEAWTNNINNDYRGCHLLKEDTLKSSLYYHLRRKLGTRFLEDNAIRIFTEFTDGGIKDMGFRADIAVVELGKEGRSYLGDNIKSIIAIIELKYGCMYTSDSYFYDDINKVKSYIQYLNWDCLYYLGFIIEKEYCHPYWLDRRQTNNWANKKLAVLSASKTEGSDNLNFYVQSCNGLNKDLDDEF